MNELKAIAKATAWTALAIWIIATFVSWDALWFLSLSDADPILRLAVLVLSILLWVIALAAYSTDETEAPHDQD